jgi:hypothetical protein
MSKTAVRSVLVLCLVGATVSCRANGKDATPDAASRPAAPCIAQNLWWGTAGEEGAAGHGLLVVGVVNTGPDRCRVEGYPSVDAEGDGPFTVKETASGFMLNDAPAEQVVLDPRGSAFFGLETTHVCDSGPRPATVLVTLKNANTGNPLPGGVSACDGRIGVGPFRARIQAVSPSG